MNDRPVHVTAAYGIILTVLVTTAILLAPGLALLAVPFAVGTALAKRAPRTAAAVIASSSALVVVLVAMQVAAGPEFWLDVVYDVVAGLLGCVAVADAIRFLARAGRPVPPLGTSVSR